MPRRRARSRASLLLAAAAAAACLVARAGKIDVLELDTASLDADPRGHRRASPTMAICSAVRNQTKNYIFEWCVGA